MIPSEGSGATLRAPQTGDAEAVAELLAPRHKDAFGRSDGALGDLLDEWGSSEFDLARDAVVAEMPDGVPAGYAVAHRFGTFAAVDRDCEGRGIGSALLDWCEARQQELGWPEHRTSIAAGNIRAKALLAARGYRLVRSNLQMRLALDRFQGAPVSAAATLRTLDVQADGAAVHELDTAAFADVPGTEPESFKAFDEEHLSAHDLDESLSRVAQQGDDEIVGFALTRRRPVESAAYVDILAVHPREHGRGIGRTLLVEVFTAAKLAGLEEAQLSVSGDNPKALRLYEGLGMKPRAQLDIYKRPAVSSPSRISP